MQPSPYRRTLVVAWTGHRQVAADAAVRAGVGDAIDRLIREHAGDWPVGGGPSPLVGIGAAALGADLIVAEALVARSIPLALVLPVEPWSPESARPARPDRVGPAAPRPDPSQFAASRFDPSRLEPTAGPVDCARIVEVLDSARSITVVPRQPTRDEAFLEAGVQAVERADVLLAVWDGQPAQGVGGTGDVVAAAVRRGVPIVRVDPASGAVAWPATLRAPVGRGAGSFLRERADVDALFERLNHEAIAAAVPWRRVLLWIILLHLAATAVAVCALLLDHHWHSLWVSAPAGILKIGALLAAIVLGYLYQPRHHGWLQARPGAEVCRSFLALWEMPRDVVVPPPAPIMATEELRRELALAWLLDPPSTPDLATARANYIGTRRKDGTPIGRLAEQKDYFDVKGTSAEKLVNRVGRRPLLVTVVALLCAIVALVLSFKIAHAGHETAGLDAAHSVAKGLSILLPLVIAAMLSIMTARDLTRRLGRYREMRQRLEAVEARVAAAGTWPSLGRAVTEGELLLLAEVGEWHAFTEHVGGSH